jgi:hypothetical protein
MTIIRQGLVHGVGTPCATVMRRPLPGSPGFDRAGGSSWYGQFLPVAYSGEAWAEIRPAALEDAHPTRSGYRSTYGSAAFADGPSAAIAGEVELGGFVFDQQIEQRPLLRNR